MTQNKKSWLQQLYTAPTIHQRLAVLTVLTVFLSHMQMLLSHRAQPGTTDGMITGIGVAFLVFILGWSSFAGSDDIGIYLTRGAAVMITSFLLHRIGFYFSHENAVKTISDDLLQNICTITIIVAVFIRMFLGLTVREMLEKIQKPVPLNPKFLQRLRSKKGALDENKNEEEAEWVT